MKLPRILPSRRRIALAALLALTGATARGGTGEREDPPSFERLVRPLLSDRCFACHGPDERARRAGLRLDTPEGLLAASSTGRPIVAPADPEGSELLARVRSSDPEERMPPPGSHLGLRAEEIALLEAWVRGGAPVERPWALRPLRPVEPPAVGDASGLRDELDAFVQQALERAGVEPNPEAPREVWLRRVHLDLTGLPPSPEQIDAFLADPGEEAYERVVDALLASPAAAEQAASRWLDVARYGDTFGYQSDVEMQMWPWRDWLLRAYARNLPYDRFLTEQLAGDLLPEADDEQRLATGFNRLHRQTNEGGSIEEEFRVEYVADRVATLGTAFLGLTLECARCHDHKFDPISQRDYYRLFGLFQNIDESGLYSHFTHATPTPTLLLYGEGQRERHAELLAELRAAEAAVTAAELAARERFESWNELGGDLPDPTPTARFELDEAEGGALVESAGGAAGRLLDAPERVVGRRGRALSFDGENGAAFGAHGTWERYDAFSVALWLRLPAADARRLVVWHRTRAGPDAGTRGVEMILESGHLEFSLVHFWPGNALRIRTVEPLPAERWVHVVATYDGSSRAAGAALHADGERLECEVLRDALTRGIGYRSEWGDSTGGVELTLAQRFRDTGFVGGAIDELALYGHELCTWELRRAASRPREDGDEGARREAYLRLVDAEVRAAREALHAARRREDAFVSGVREVMVMREDPRPKPCRVLARGAYDAPGAAVEPGVPELLFDPGEAYPADRLGLARWLTHPEHPLTARVAVNRAWERFFGRGLVATTENLGSQGASPTHPELLDHLAAEFVRRGWDQHALWKRLVLSATYRRSSAPRSDLLARDPENLLLARGPRHRLRGEEIRDQALAASGLLVERLGGPSVKPYQPEGLWADSGTGKRYVPDRGEGLWRRSLYTFWRRTLPPPALGCFDAPSREVALARRERTGTPLQALVLLNDPQFVEAARALAESVLQEDGLSSEERLATLFRRCLTRRASERELSTLAELLGKERAHFAADPDAARAFLAVGERAPAPGFAPDELAAWAAVAQVLFNHFEFRTKT